MRTLSRGRSLIHGSNVMSAKQKLNGATGLGAAMNDARRVFPRLIAVAAAAATVSAQAEPASLDEVRTAARPALAADAGRATSAEAPLLDETSVAGFEVIWAGRLSISAAPADASQWWWLRARGSQCGEGVRRMNRIEPRSHMCGAHPKPVKCGARRFGVQPSGCTARGRLEPELHATLQLGSEFSL